MINDEEEGVQDLHTPLDGLLEGPPNDILNIQITGGVAAKRQSVDSFNKGGGKIKGGGKRHSP